MIGFISLVLFLSSCSGDQLSYVDPAAHILFPHPIVPRSDGHLPGHLENLGHQRPSLGQIPEYFEIPTPRELWDKQVKPYRPAVLRNALKGSPALDEWTDENLTKDYGDQEVLIEKKYEDRKTEPKRMVIKDFLEQYHLHNWYVVSMLPDAMRKDVKIPKPLMCSSFKQNIVELNLWIGTKGTRSMLHCDADNILHCVVSGRKDWMLIHPDNRPKLDIVINRQGQSSGFSHLPVDAIDESVNPEVWDVPWEYVTLYGGDCLYLPPRYFHQVRSYNRSISSTFLFYPRNKFSDEDCKDVDFDKDMRLNETYVAWTYEKNQETVDMGYMNPVNLKAEYELLFDSAGLTTINTRHFLHLVVSIHDEAALEGVKYFMIFFRALDKNNDHEVSKKELQESDMEIWKDWCRGLDNPHGPTKKFLNENRKASSAEPGFLPRTINYYADSINALCFLKFLIRAKGKNNAITYPEFKKWVQVQERTVADAFITVDLNFDGRLTLEELLKVNNKSLRDFNKMYYRLKGTNIFGGGPYEESHDENNLEYLNQLNDIPEESYGGDEETESITTEDREDVVKQFLSEFKDYVSLQPESKIGLELFQQFVTAYKLPEKIDVMHFDSAVAFAFIDRGKKGYISLEDANYYVLNKPIVETIEISKDEMPTVDFEGAVVTYPPVHVLNRIISHMDVLHGYFEKVEKLKQRRQQKKNKKSGMEKTEAESDESEAESDDEEKHKEWKKEEL